MNTINSPIAPMPIGPYSQAVHHNGLIYVSGQIGIDPLSSALVEGIANQTNQILKNIENILMEAQSSLLNVLKVEIFLKNIADFDEVNKIYALSFTHNPSRQTIEVSALPKASLIEISCIAFK